MAGHDLCCDGTTGLYQPLTVGFDELMRVIDLRLDELLDFRGRKNTGRHVGQSVACDRQDGDVCRLSQEMSAEEFARST